VADSFERGGNVIIPTFALERAQRAGIEQHRLSRSIQVFLDSPMAISATAIFERYSAFYGQRAAELFHEGGEPFQLPACISRARPPTRWRSTESSAVP